MRRAASSTFAEFADILKIEKVPVVTNHPETDQYSDLSSRRGAVNASASSPGRMKVRDATSGTSVRRVAVAVPPLERGISSGAKPIASKHY